MAKRSNPFVEDYVQQSKVHVSVKQFNNNEGRLQKVYEKTLDLLFRGAKGKGVLNPMAATVSQDTAHNKLKQLFIGKNGGLERNGTLMASSGPVVCSCGCSASDYCAYCEARLCQQCAQACGTCQLNYCTRCSIVSDGGEVCVSCYA